MCAHDTLPSDCERIVQFAPVSIMCFDAEGIITYVNDWHLANFARGKRGRDYFLGTCVLDLPGIVTSGIRDDLAAILAGRSIHLEAVYSEECSGGQSAYQSIRGIPIVEGGIVTGGIIIREDVTNLVLSQQLLAENQAIFKAMLDATRDSILLTDTDGFIQILNEEAARRRGRSVADLLGVSVYATLSPRLAESRRTNILAAVDKKEIQFVEEQHGAHWYLVSLCPIIGNDGQVVAIASYSRDVTALKETENQLIKEKTLAFSASQAKSQFLGNITHELRTPLNGIMGACQLALSDPRQAGDSELWRIVDASSKRLLGIVNNVLELADIDAAAIEPSLAVCDVKALLATLARGYSVRAKLKDISLSVECDPRIPDRLLGDIHRVRQVLANLVDNAIRCTPSGSVRVRVKRITSKRMAYAGDYHTLLFMVSDTGIGIAKDAQARIFEDFELAEPYLTKRVSGAGIGLGIARHLVEMLGGMIWVKSELGKGSHFYFTVPFAVPEAGQDLVLEPAVPLTAGLPPERYTILLVEDETINRLTTGRTLAKLGYRVLEAGDGQEALTVLARQTADLVLMDIQMPVMDGIECAHHIRNGEVPGLSKRVPIVALTAYASEKDRQRLLGLGMDDYLAKPHSMEQLRTVLEVNLRRTEALERRRDS
jgi:PAS domain S-box-containing protein